jgi:PIN domain nuclease of toxin-antitoxin system
VTAVVADTHVAIWFLFEPNRLSPAAYAVLAEAYRVGDPVYLASVSLVETQFLEERGRVRAGTLARLVAELRSPDAVLTLVALDEPLALAVGTIPRAIVPEMPDRIIAATARYLGVPLVTRDHEIRGADIETIW